MSDHRKEMSHAIEELVASIGSTFFEKLHDGPSATTKASGTSFIESFTTKPSELMAFLEKKVIKQKEAIRVLATKVCGHYNAIRCRIEHGENPMDDIDRIKSNIILIGDTGVGKTYLLKLVAHRLGIPFIKVDATKFTEAGYVGGDVEDIIRELAKRTKNAQGKPDIELAQYGIVFIDEIDKIASGESRRGIDVSRRGVQQALLTLIEDADVPAIAKLDIIGQANAAQEAYDDRKKYEQKVINTRNILFIFSGAFPGLTDIIKKRTQKNDFGFTMQTPERVVEKTLLTNVVTNDLLEYGFEPEFAGRIPVRVAMDYLEKDDLLSILNKPDSPIIAQFKDVMSSYGVTVHFDSEVFEYIAELAVQENTGARGLQSAFEKTVGIYESFLSDLEIPEFRFTLPMIDGTYNSSEFMAQLKEKVDKKLEVIRQEIKQKQERSTGIEGYADYVHEKYDLLIEFDDSATTAIKEKTAEAGISEHETCKQVFSEMENAFGLLSKVREKLTVTEEGVNNPAKFLEKAFKSK